MDESRYNAAVERNLAELQRALLNRRAMVAVESIGSVTNFILKVLYYALFNDYISHCIKVFERSSGAASFWYIYDTNQKPLNIYAKAHNIDIAAFQVLTEKLAHVRNKTHFHIDREGVLDPQAAWREADINGAVLAAAVDAVWALLNDLQRSRSRPPMVLPPFDDDVLRRTATLIQKERA